jgi:transposase
VRRYNERGLDGLRDRPKPGRPQRLSAGEPAALRALILKGPAPERDGCVAWRLRALCALTAARFGVRYREAGLLRLVKSLDLSWPKPRPAPPAARRAEQARWKQACRP